MSDKNRASGNDFKSYLPPELLDFVVRDTYSLLIKGSAGTGKTTLSLTILRAIKTQTRFFYISTRTSPKQLFQYYPWLEQFAELKSDEVRGDSQEHSASFEDARLDEPESLFERITNQLMDIKSPVIVIDSWDAVASFMDKEARLNNERVLQTWRERAGAKLIFISEHPDDTTLDFLVDGVVELRQYQYNETSLREITLRKMRGVRIARQSYFYSLEDAVFHCLPPYSPPFLENSQWGEAATVVRQAKRKSIDHFSTGYEILDHSLGGGLPRRGIVLLELDKHVGTMIPMMLMGNAIGRFLADGNPVLFGPFDTIEAEIIFQCIAPFLPKNLKRNLLKVFSLFGSSSTKGTSDYILSSPKSRKGQDPLISAVTNMKRWNHDRPVLQVLSAQDLYDRLIRSQTSGTDTELYALGNRVGRDLIVAVARTSNQDSLKHLAEICDVHLKLVVLNGTLFMQSLLPASITFGLTADSEKTYKLLLQPMV